MAQYLSFMEDMNVYSDDDRHIQTTTSISPLVKKSYEQQLLPIRQQSLPSYQSLTTGASPPVPIRKSSISVTTRHRREHKEHPPVQPLVKQARRKISVRHRSSKSETSLVIKLKTKPQRRYSAGGKRIQEPQDLLNYFYHYTSFNETLRIKPYQSSCISALMNCLLDSSYHHQKRLWHGDEIVDQLLAALDTSYRQVAIDAASALPLIQVNGPPLDSISDSKDYLYRLPTTKCHPVAITQHEQEASLLRELYQGVFVPLSKCYAPRCTRDQTCYSRSCPNKQVTPITANVPSSKPKPIWHHENHTLWIHSVPRTIVSTTLTTERYRQEAIYELIQTEIDFVGHLRYVEKYWIDPLEQKNKSIAQQVFWNWKDVLQVNTGLKEALVTQQQQDHRIIHVGNILLAHVEQFEPFVIYGSHQLVGKFYFELEKKRNPWFARFVKDTEQKPESERLELNGYLTKITTRLARYPILLNTILRWTPVDHVDHELLGHVLEIIGSFLQRLDDHVGQVSHQFELEQLSERLLFNKFTQSKAMCLDLKSPRRRLIHQGRMQRTSLDGDIQVFLFDHLLIFTKVKIHHHLEYYRPFGKWIPLDSLTFAVYDQKATRHRQELYLIAFQQKDQVGGAPITLVTPNEISRRNWVEKLTQPVRIG